MSRWGWLVSLILVAGIVGTAKGVQAEVPRFDVDGYCQDVAETGGSSNVIFNGCIDMEQRAYRNVKRRWGSVPERTRRYCTDVARTGGAGSYSILEGCVDMEQEAAENRRSFRYE